MSNKLREYKGDYCIILLKKLIMIIFGQKSRFYLLCIICTSFMCLTSTFNIICIIYRSYSYNNNQYTKVSTIYDQKNNKTNDSERIFREKIDYFEETFGKFVRLFHQYSFSIVQTQSISSNYCLPVPPELQGPLKVHELPENFSIINNSSYHVDVQLGGHYQPKTCVARHKVALIVPYRDRWDILNYFLFHIHHILQRQELDYRIYVCEQAFNKTFNKGIIMNGCFKEILKLQPNIPCFIMHDVDLLLIDDRNMYSCPSYPRHLSVAIDKFHFHLPYPELVGGVLGKNLIYFFPVSTIRYVIES